MLKKKMLQRVSLLFLSISLVILTSCAPPSKRTVEIYWPLPPEEPRIKWLRWIRGEIDVVKKDSKELFLDAVVGKKQSGINFSKPYGVHFAGNRLYVADTGVGRVAVFDLETQSAFQIGTGGRGVLQKPVGIATDKDGNIYVSDSMQNRVVVFNKNGSYLYALGKGKQFGRPIGIGINDELGRVYVVDIKAHNIQVFSKEGEFLFDIGTRGTGEVQFNFPTNIFIGSDGRIYVSDSMNFRIQILDADGKFISQFGELGDGLGMFNRPKGVAVDSEGHIYVVDASFNNIQIFNEEGQLLLSFGMMGHDPGQFWLPAGMWIDENDKIYVADQYNQRINIFQYLGKKYKERQKAIESSP